MVSLLKYTTVVAVCGLALAPAWAQDEAQPAEAPPADPISWLDGWKGSVNAGLFGSEGNTERLSATAILEAKREHTRWDSHILLLYSLARDDGENSQNYFLASARNDWKFGDSPWVFFAKGTFEYDEFQDWDQRVTLFAGPGYHFIRNDTTSLLGRVGAGVSKEFGSDDDEWKPELNIGADFSHKIDSRQTFTASADYYPALDGFPEYRAEFKAEYAVLLNDDNNMNLKIGALDRYDSTPGLGFKRNDLDYYITIGWEF